MSLTDIIKGLKDTAIDAATYDLLERNAALLEKSNAALTENNDILQGQITERDKRIAELAAEIERLRKPTTDRHHYEPSTVASAILQLYHQTNATELYDVDIEESLSHSHIEIQSALSDLRNNDIIRQSGYDDGCRYLLTDHGMKLVLKTPTRRSPIGLRWSTRATR